jgi:protein SCO1/2
MTLRVVRWTAIALLVAVLGAWGAVWSGLLGGHGAGGVAGLSSGLQVGGPFRLTDSSGHVVTDASYRGKWMLVYFGYTYCPDVCPTELQAVAAGLDKLGPLAKQVAPLFITIDPERDTPAAMGQYTKLFDDRLVGLTGTEQEIAAVAKEYRVYYARVTPKGGGAYLMDHSSFLYLMGPDGQLRALFKPGMDGTQIADGIRERMNAS